MKPSDKLMIMLMGSKKPKEESEKKEPKKEKANERKLGPKALKRYESLEGNPKVKT